MGGPEKDLHVVGLDSCCCIWSQRHERPAFNSTKIGQTNTSLPRMHIEAHPVHPGDELLQEDHVVGQTHGVDAEHPTDALHDKERHLVLSAEPLLATPGGTAIAAGMGRHGVGHYHQLPVGVPEDALLADHLADDVVEGGESERGVHGGVVGVGGLTAGGGWDVCWRLGYCL